MQSLRFALQPAVVDISVTWDVPKGVSVTVLSPPITALFQGQRSLVYAQLTGQVRAAPSHSEISLWLDLSGLKNMNNSDLYVSMMIRLVSNTVMLSQSSEAAEGCVTVKYSLAGHPSQNQLHFSLKPAEDTG